MKKSPLPSVVLFLLTSCVVSISAKAEILVQWNFNYPLSADMSMSDDSVLTGTNAPCIGTGTLSTVGGAVLQGTGYDSGDPNCPPCDPFYQFTANNPKTGPNTNNSSITITNFPAQGTANKTAGYEVSVNTVGYTNVSVSWSQRHQQRTGRYHRLQYSLDGATFQDVPAAQGGVIAITTQNIFYPQTNHLSSVNPAVENNPNLKLRLVAEFQSTAENLAGADYYVGSVAGDSGNYRRDSEVRLDMLTVWADASGAPVNEFPTITVAQTNMATIGSASVTNEVTIGDAETPVNALVISTSSGNTGLVPSANIKVLDDSGAVRRVAVTPAPTCEAPSGTASISVSVTDGNGQTTAAGFEVTIASALPSILNAVDAKSLQNNPGTSTFTLFDPDTPVSSLGIQTASSIPAVVAGAGSIVVSGTDSNRTVTLMPQPDALGGTMISIAANDGSCSSTNSFLYMVVPNPDVILYESFDNYADGPLTTEVGGGVWLNIADTPGDIKIQSKALRLDTTLGEEFIRCPLASRTNYPATGSPPLYAAVKFKLLQLPVSPTPGINSHVGHFSGRGVPGAQRARFFTGYQDAAPGMYRLGISSSQNTPTAYLPVDLALNETYTVVTHYNPTNGLARLWVNPSSESDTFAEATDVQTADIELYAFRQRPVSSDAIVDDLVVATSFAGALLQITQAPVLQVEMTGGGVRLSWPVSGSAGYELYSTDSLTSGTWGPTGDTPVVQDGRNTVTISDPQGTKFYRLRKP
jgi:hypothetical protein